MKIIKPSVELMHTGYEKENVTPEQLIEKVGRTCYKSEDKITADSAAKFVGNLIKRGHEAMIEHWTLIFKTDAVWYQEILSDWDMLLHDGNIPMLDRLRPYLRFTDSGYEEKCRCIISGNMRAWRDYIRACEEGFGLIPQYLHGLIRNYPLFFPEYQDKIPEAIVNDILIPIGVDELEGPIEHGVHHDVTVKFICDRGVSHEIVRHRTASFAQESTRYCNYGLGKFGGEISVIMPAKWLKANVEELPDDPAYQAWSMALANSEHYYFDMLDAGCTPQEARAVLLNSLKTEIIVTMNLNNWDHFFGLRCAPDAHPDIQVVACMAARQFDEEVYSHV